MNARILIIDDDPDNAEQLVRFVAADASETRVGFLPVIVLTGDVGKSARNEALVLGADDFLTKPLDRHEVVLRVRNLLHTRRLYTELANTNQALEKALRKSR